MARIVLRKGDVAVINGYSIDVDTLKVMLQPNRRVLWAFIPDNNNDIQPVAYSEEHVIWLQPSDLERTDAPNPI